MVAAGLGEDLLLVVELVSPGESIDDALGLLVGDQVSLLQSIQ